MAETFNAGWSMSDELEKRRLEKLAARPQEVDYNAALAIAKQQLTDLLDDKYLALGDEIRELRKQVVALQRPSRFARLRGRFRQWKERRRRKALGLETDYDD